MKKAFTLIELIVVLAILAVLTLISLPVYNNIIANAQQSRGYANAKTCYNETVLYQISQLTDIDSNTKIDQGCYALAYNYVARGYKNQKSFLNHAQTEIDGAVYINHQEKTCHYYFPSSRHPGLDELGTCTYKQELSYLNIDGYYIYNNNSIRRLINLQLLN